MIVTIMFAIKLPKAGQNTLNDSVSSLSFFGGRSYQARRDLTKLGLDDSVRLVDGLIGFGGLNDNLFTASEE